MYPKTKINPNLKYNFNTNGKLEIQLRTKNRMGDKIKTKYVSCTPNVFRSFHGKRRIDGKNFKGQVYCFDSNAIYGIDAFMDNKKAVVKVFTPKPAPTINLRIVRKSTKGNFFIRTNFDGSIGKYKITFTPWTR